MKVIILLAVTLTWFSAARYARADSACSGGGPSADQEACLERCPSILTGDCSNSEPGTKGCATDPNSICLSMPTNCTKTVDGAAVPTRTDAGAPILYCLAITYCGEVEGCTIGSDDSRSGRLAGLPAGLIASGILLLAVDRRRRRRRQD
jgi:hypothetical protein